MLWVRISFSHSYHGQTGGYDWWHYPSNLFAGIMLHGLAKVIELSGPENTGLPCEAILIVPLCWLMKGGQNLGGAESDSTKGEWHRFAPCLLSHHGLLEYGGPVRPKIMEAEIHMIDNLDAESDHGFVVAPGKWPIKFSRWKTVPFYKPKIDKWIRKWALYLMFVFWYSMI